MAGTMENLKEAFAGECQAFRKYLMFAAAAEKEGLPNIAKLFRTTAEAERLHAEGHFRSLDGVGRTVDNLKAAIGGETHEYTRMYPPMLKQAEADNHKAKRMFEFAVKAEEVHAKLYTQALEAAVKGRDLQAEFYLCPFCGYIEMGKPAADCPICGAKPEKFITV
ncbi:MAG TPA: rubrerythrin family protein [Phycisphaerae bacterium]|nr:rubrerythrin family protein [Phycisphaerae bacterium]